MRAYPWAPEPDRLCSAGHGDLRPRVSCPRQHPLPESVALLQQGQCLLREQASLWHSMFLLLGILPRYHGRWTLDPGFRPRFCPIPAKWAWGGPLSLGLERPLTSLRTAVSSR